jgi:two-component system sensor histidine kinase KdpD
LLDELIRGSGPIEVHVIAPIDSETSPAPAQLDGQRDRATVASYVGAGLAIAMVTAVCLVAFDYISLADITMLYLIAIMLAALLGRGPSLLAASLAVAAFDFCFVPPRYTFAVSDIGHILTFAVMFASGIAISTLTLRIRRQERDAIEREQRTAALLAFTREVASATTVADVAAVTARHVEDALDVAAAVLVPDPDEGLVAAAGLAPLAAQEIVVARWAFEHRTIAGHGTDTLPAARALCVPLVDGKLALGVLAIQRRPGTPVRLGVEQRHLIDAIARQTAVAVSRVVLGEQAREAALRARTEELRSALLSAVSHDLRTPLAVITGAATTLRDDADRLTVSARAELLASIVDDARRLERVLANLLQLSRVETGFTPAREWVPAEELVGAALTRLEDALGDRKVELDVEPDLLLSIDPVLFEQVLINLIENAIKHGAPPLTVRARRRGEDVRIEVSDRGNGLPPDSGRLFEKFVRASKAPGVGLGLAVVRAVVEAHGGTVSGENVEGGGARFVIELPAAVPPPNLATRPSSPYVGEGAATGVRA